MKGQRLVLGWSQCLVGAKVVVSADLILAPGLWSSYLTPRYSGPLFLPVQVSERESRMRKVSPRRISLKVAMEFEQSMRLFMHEGSGAKHR